MHFIRSIIISRTKKMKYINDFITKHGINYLKIRPEGRFYHVVLNNIDPNRHVQYYTVKYNKFINILYAYYID